MINRNQRQCAIADLAANPEQKAAVEASGHCVVLAGPGSGKTKTLTVAMARTLLEEVVEPRGIACITYNNECALELESRLKSLWIEPSERIFIGTVHSFALTQVILPYARCVLPELPSPFRVATSDERTSSIASAYARAIGGRDDPRDRWRFAEPKRRTQLDRTSPEWMGRNPELARFIEAYEDELRKLGLIDFDDMPLIALRMARAHPWIREALHAKFPVLFVDEYQDLGHALHELVLLLCFDGNIRLFAVGDPDQSIYAFTGANPRLLIDLADRADVQVEQLRFNYRCGTSIIEASKAALGEDRDYVAHDGADQGTITFHPVQGDLDAQAEFVITTLLPSIQQRGTTLEKIAILYRDKRQGESMAQAASGAGIPVVRADSQALVSRNSRFSRFAEACARWVVGGWRDADPSFRRLRMEACVLVHGREATEEERRRIELELITFLHDSIGKHEAAYSWLVDFRDSLIQQWRTRSRNITSDWHLIDQMIERTDPSASDSELPLSHFGGRIEDGSGRLNLSTLHSAKGREFDVVILFAMNSGVLPSWHDERRVEALREARRLFYVGVTRARSELHLVFQRGHHSPWVAELYTRMQSGSAK